MAKTLSQVFYMLYFFLNLMTIFWSIYDYYHHFANKYYETQKCYNLPEITNSKWQLQDMYSCLTPEAKLLATIIC